MGASGAEAGAKDVERQFAVELDLAVLDEVNFGDLVGTPPLFSTPTLNNALTSHIYARAEASLHSAGMRRATGPDLLLWLSTTVALHYCSCCSRGWVRGQSAWASASVPRSDPDY